MQIALSAFIVFSLLAGCKSTGHNSATPENTTMSNLDPTPHPETADMDNTLDQITIAQIKAYPVSGDLDKNHLTIMNILAEIENTTHVDVVVTPECWLDGYVAKDKNVKKQDMPRYAVDPENSKYTQAIAEWSRRNHCWFIYGCTRKADNGVYNTALICNRQGRLIGHYDKIHLQKHDLKFEFGQHLNVYDSDFGKFGVMICADRRWPETTRTLALKGARIVFNPTYGFKHEMNTCIMRTRSFENGIVIAFTHPGLSLVTAPKGKVICFNQDDKKFTITTVNLKNANPLKNNHIIDRRPDVYQLD